MGGGLVLLLIRITPLSILQLPTLLRSDVRSKTFLIEYILLKPGTPIQMTMTPMGVMNLMSFIRTKGRCFFLLKNYELVKVEKMNIETTYNRTMFSKMLTIRGNRIFIDNYNHLYSNISRDGKRSFCLEFVT